jgi:hypothetical protein
MKTLAPWCAVLGLVLAAACSKGTRVDSPATAGIASGTEPEAPGALVEPDADDSGWSRAWTAVVTGAEETADAGEWTLSRTDDGGVAVERSIQRVAGTTARAPTDAARLGQVKARLAQSSKVDASGIDVDVVDGEVTLRGEANSREAAAAAVRTALESPGVERVVSYLTWLPLP